MGEWCMRVVVHGGNVAWREMLRMWVMLHRGGAGAWGIVHGGYLGRGIVHGDVVLGSILLPQQQVNLASCLIKPEVTEN